MTYVPISQILQLFYPSNFITHKFNIIYGDCPCLLIKVFSCQSSENNCLQWFLDKISKFSSERILKIFNGIIEKYLKSVREKDNKGLIRQYLAYCFDKI